MWLILALYISLNSDPMILTDFNNASELQSWYVVNDGVMGGLSKGYLRHNDAGYAVFSGDISLDNNGGFSSIRKTYNKQDISGYTYAVLKVRGDGKKYQFRVKSSSREYHSYVYEFSTQEEWEEIIIPLKEMRPQFRGRKLNIPDYDAQSLSEIALLIGNKKEESFSLEIAAISLR